MDQSRIARIKKAIRDNFDSSGDPYDAFEARHKFFWMLTSKLLDAMKVPADARVLDVGCGTGASCAHILEACPGARVWGLDISPLMLEKARQRFTGNERVTFVEGDAARLTEYFQEPFDAVVYGASIFLIPDYRESLRQARELLKEAGGVGLTFMDGVYDADNRNLLEVADRAAGEGVSLKKPVKWTDFEVSFRETFPCHRVWQERFPVPLDVLREFFSVPAMSAGLFPGVPYPERVRKVGRLFDHLTSRDTLFCWMFLVGEKTART
jgi:ubiquinone/menaquinone biosynthesis C-methylase UbiE